MPRKEQGYALLASLFALAIFAAMLAMYFKWLDQKMVYTRAEVEGEALGQFAVGLRGFVAQAQADPSIIPSGTLPGVDWLKSPSCGATGALPSNPKAGHVPCSFTGANFGRHYSTTFFRNAATNEIEVRTTFKVKRHGTRSKSEMLMADHLATTALSQQSLPNNGMFYTVYANVPEGATSPELVGSVPATSDQGRIVLVVNNAPSNDLWLRTDGTNKMLANLNMDGWSIANAKDARFTGTVQIDDGLVVDEDALVDFRGTVRASDIELTSIDKFASEGIYAAVAGRGPGYVDMPKCSGVGTPGIYIATQWTGEMSSTGSDADAIYSAGATATVDGNRWRITPKATGVKFGLDIDDTRLQLTRTLLNVEPANLDWVAFTRCR